MKQHSIIGASSLYRWGECPGSIRLCKDLPNRTNEYAELGTLAHDVAEKILRGETTESEARILHGDELVDAVMVYVNYIGEMTP